MREVEQLVRSARAGDNAAFGELVQLFERALWVSAFRISGDWVAWKEVIARGIRLLASYDAWKGTRSNSFALCPELPSYNPKN